MTQPRSLAEHDVLAYACEGYRGTRHESVAGIAARATLDWLRPRMVMVTPLQGPVVGARSRVLANRDKKRAAFRAAKRHAMQEVRYEFTGIGWLLIGWIVSGIVSAIVRRLIEYFWGSSQARAHYGQKQGVAKP